MELIIQYKIENYIPYGVITDYQECVLRMLKLLRYFIE